MKIIPLAKKENEFLIMSSRILWQRCRIVKIRMQVHVSIDIIENIPPLSYLSISFLLL